MKKVFNVFMEIMRIVFAVIAWIAAVVYLSLQLYDNTFVESHSFVFFIILVIVAICAFLIIFLWQKYNYHKFGKLDRRAFPLPVSVDEIGGVFLTDGGTVESFQASQILELHITGAEDAEGEKSTKKIIMTCPADAVRGELSPPDVGKARNLTIDASGAPPLETPVEKP